MKKLDRIGRPCPTITGFIHHQLCFLESLFRLSTQGRRITILELMPLVIAWFHNTQNDVGHATASNPNTTCLEMSDFIGGCFKQLVIMIGYLLEIKKFYWTEWLERPENELMCEKKIDALPDVELCYINNIPTEPFLVATKRIQFFPFRYQRYRRHSSEEAGASSSASILPSSPPSSNQCINCDSQLIEFVNNVFLITDPNNETIYERKEMTSEDIFNITKQYTTLFEKKTLGSFTQFSTKNKAHYLKADIVRVRTESGHRVERKVVYIMKADDRAFLAKNIENYQENYETFIKGLKTDGFAIVGYARKSPGSSSGEALKKNLQNMINCLQERSLVESVYVSPSSLAKSSIPSRDMLNTDEELMQMKLDHCAGSTQALLKHLSSTEQKVCLVIVDYAALSTVPDDVQDLVRNHKALEYIIVDRLKEVGRYEVYSRLQILETPECLDSFDCRKGLPHRST